MAQEVTNRHPNATLTRKEFDAAIDEKWPLASRVPLHPRNREAMWAAYTTMGLSVRALCAGFAFAIKSGKMR